MARPRQFDETEVLEKAADVFWAKGYEATTTRDLTQAMGVTHASLYNAFGDKRALFLRTLDYYLDQTLRARIGHLEGTYSPTAAVRQFFAEVVERSLADPQHRGCMLVNSALEVAASDSELQRLVADETRMIEDFFVRSVAAGQSAGEIPAGQPPTTLGRHLLGVLMGLRVLARIRPERELLYGIVAPALALLGQPWPVAEGAAMTGPP